MILHGLHSIVIVLSPALGISTFAPTAASVLLISKNTCQINLIKDQKDFGLYSLEKPF